MSRRSTTPTSPQGQRLLLIVTQQRLGTLSALSRATGVTASRLSQATTDARPLGPRLCARLADATGYRAAWLLTGDGPPKAHQPGGPEWRHAQSQRLQLVLQERGLNPEELAPLAGLSVRTVREASALGHGVSAAVAAAVEAATGYRAAWLRTGDGTPLLLPPALAQADATGPGAPSAREVAVTAAVLNLIERYAPAYLTPGERHQLVALLAVRVLHPRSFLPALPKPPIDQGVTPTDGVTVSGD